MTAHEFSFRKSGGGDLPLAAWRGKSVLVVNTASECGFTPQYAELETLWRRYRDKGFVLLAVPSNDFGGQEPGADAEIKSFCETNYAIDFPLAAKEKTVGPDAHAFYRWIVAELGETGAPRWNFHKYLIGPDGALLGTWPSRVSPIDSAITHEIENAINA
jgi:glutathione peroxidase